MLFCAVGHVHFGCSIVADGDSMDVVVDASGEASKDGAAKKAAAVTVAVADKYITPLEAQAQMQLLWQKETRYTHRNYPLPPFSFLKSFCFYPTCYGTRELVSRFSAKRAGGLAEVRCCF